jgi:c-di-GMP-binding flagellar brake protein YcgR
MLHEVLSIGDKIDITPLNPSGRPVAGARALVSQLVDIVDTNVVNIAAPIMVGRTIPLPVGDNFRLCFYTEKGLYQCSCMVISNHRDNKTIITVVRITSNLEKLQRRQYYRLECIQDIEYRPVTIEEEILDKKVSTDDFDNPEELAEAKKQLALFDKEWITGSVTDISGGGARFSSEKQHEKGDKLIMKLDIVVGKELRKLELTSKVISSNRIPVRAGLFEHRVQFIEITQKEREVLIKYIFEQDRKRRKNDIG